MNSGSVAGIALLNMVIIVLALIILYGLRYKRVPPNKAMIIFGRRTNRTRKGYRILTAGGKFIVPMVESVAYLPLDVKNLKLSFRNVKTEKNGSNPKVTIDLVAQVKIGSDSIALDAAAEQLLGKSDAELKEIASNIIEAQTRALCSTVDKKKLKEDLGRLSERIELVVAIEFRNIGLEVRSMVVSEVK